MCTYNISINDNIMQKAVSSFNSERAMQSWIQQNIELLLLQHLAQVEAVKVHAQSNPKTHALSAFRGILQSDKSPAMVREEYIEEKYGI